jgi:hypothetical protein
MHKITWYNNLTIMKQLWSFSTTIRNPERILSFLNVVNNIDGYTWNKETQNLFQIQLIKNRIYIPNENNLSVEQILLLKDSKELTFDEAKSIYNSKKYIDESMRGRTSLDPLEKMGLVSVIENVLNITKKGKKLLSQEITLSEMILDSLLKLQYPNPNNEKGFNEYDYKPFIGMVHFIYKLNKITDNKGLNREEFGIFILSITNYIQIESKVNDLLLFRKEKSALVSDIEKRRYVKEYIKNYLNDFKNPEKNIREYSDNVIRYIRLTGFITISNYDRINLEYRKSVEIDSIIEQDVRAAKFISKKQWIEFIGSYQLNFYPWFNEVKLGSIQTLIIEEINSSYLGHEKEINDILNNENIINRISLLRQLKNKLYNESIKTQFKDLSKIDQLALEFLSINKSERKLSVELERISARFMFLLNDAISIKPNYPVGDDNEPTYTAPAGVPDIECFYNTFNLIVEVTMLSNRDQWFNEGQPVMRHLRKFEDLYNDKRSLCLFIAPKIHQDTLNTFWNSVKYEYEGAKQSIIPINFKQVSFILVKFKEFISSGKELKNIMVLDLLNKCTELKDVKTSKEWEKQINLAIENWLI